MSQQFTFFIPCYYLLVQIHLFQQTIYSKGVFSPIQYPVMKHNLANAWVCTMYAANANNPNLNLSLAGARALQKILACKRYI